MHSSFDTPWLLVQSAWVFMHHLCIHLVVICRLFEPYVIHVIGKLLNCYSDSARLVREGAHAAARAIMGNLSGQGQ